MEGVGDGTHLITTSFIKRNDKIRDQLLKNIVYFSDLMHEILMALRFIPSIPRNHFPFQPLPRIRTFPQLATRSEIFFLYRTSTPLSPEIGTNQKHPAIR
jgi:hypothetical protein